jgi:hypothetical protein
MTEAPFEETTWRLNGASELGESLVFVFSHGTIALPSRRTTALNR